MHNKLGFLALGALLAVAGGLRAGDDAYPRPDLLVEPSQLARPEAAQRFVVLDAREHKRWQHHPGPEPKSWPALPPTSEADEQGRRYTTIRRSGPMRYARALAFAGLRQALAFPGLLTGDDPWGDAIRQRPLTRSELWTITKPVEAVLGRVLGLDPRRNLAANQEEARRMIEGNNRSEGRLSA
jgi:hypothetical protein